MDPFRLRSLIAPAMASLFLVLSLCAFVVQRPPSVGIHIPMTRVRAVPFSDCFDDRDVFVRIDKDGSTWINQTRENPGKLGPVLAEIFQNRNEQRVVYVLPDPDVSFGEFADIYDKVASSTQDLHVGLITSQLTAQLEQCPLGSTCGFEWPDQRYSHSCLYFNIPPVPIPRHSSR
jgi:biopolymer transport protein ExbD